MGLIARASIFNPQANIAELPPMSADVLNPQAAFRISSAIPLSMGGKRMRGLYTASYNSASLTGYYKNIECSD